MFHCLVIKVVLLSALCDSLFRLSHLEELVKNFFQKFFEVFSKGFRRRHFSYLFKRLDYFTISSVDCQQLILIFWKLIYFSVFQKQFLATACLIYHCRKEKSSTFSTFSKTFLKSVSIQRQLPKCFVFYWCGLSAKLPPSPIDIPCHPW